MNDFDTPAPLIGGPYHGRMVVSPHDDLKHPDPQYDMMAYHRRNVPPEPLRQWYRMYTRRSFSIEYGTLRLEGVAWVWDVLNESEWEYQAVGLLLAAAMVGRQR